MFITIVRVLNTYRQVHKLLDYTGKYWSIVLTFSKTLVAAYHRAVDQKKKANLTPSM